MSRFEARLAADVASYGWHVAQVLEDDEGPGFADTIGLFRTFGHPEVILFGLPLDTMGSILNQVGAEVRRGARFGDGAASAEVIEDGVVRFRGVDPSWHDEFFGQAIRYYDDAPFPTLQCFWPDGRGRFPWDGGARPELRALQPALQAPRGGPA